jgi:membrane-bound serine protease (ClpP class)
LGEQRVSFDIPNDLKEINLIEVEMRPGEKLLNVLAHPNIAAILMTLGLLLIYAEISAPGIGVAGIAGGLCLLIAFIGLQALPVQAGGLALLALGAALLIAELFVVSGGALAVGGLVSFVLGLLWLFDPGAGDLQISTSVLVFSIGTIAVGVGLLIWAASRTRSLQRKTLETTGGGELSGLKGYVGRVDSVDSSGHAGLILIRGEIWKFTSEKPVQQGDSVQVVEVHGLSVKIEKQEA